VQFPRSPEVLEIWNKATAHHIPLNDFLEKKSPFSSIVLSNSWFHF